MAIAGLRGTGSFSAAERPLNWRSALLLLKPNTKASLTALTGQLKSESTDSTEFKIFTKDLPNQRMVLSATTDTVATTLTFNTSIQDTTVLKPGHILFNERTQEVMWVVTVPTSGTVTVQRAKGSSAANQAIGDGLTVIGTTHPEGADVPLAIAYPPDVKTNYTQIFRTSLNITGTAQAERLRYADNAKIEMKREILELHAIEIEKQFWFGSGVEDLTGSQPQRTTKGLYFWITTNIVDFNDSVDIDTFENYLEDLFENGSDERVHFLGNRQLNVLNKLARNWGEFEVMPSSETFGLRIMRWIVPYGTLMLKQHPLFSNNPTFNDWGFSLDFNHLVYRYLRGRDTQYLTNRQSPGADVETDEFLTECGLECQFEETHGLMKNALNAIV